ncbi:hypothetical protein [Cohnella nanjingensis]|uniref:Uncharacterized protein n=1 Tax=Cohnella nanjingensis TaxID=1387779 RepID=A0A7X0RNR5_9BACL|nr:hypothetical protein [Cohnella nanjingensis]MBB6669736.1 hypothetical protein [Cohnella nanjingensis]
METYDLAQLSIAQASRSWQVPFDRAKLYVIHEYGTLSWYVDVEGVNEAALLSHFAASEEIGVTIAATTIGGRTLGGSAYFHPNPMNQAAALRGQGELEGYGPGLASR